MRFKRILSFVASAAMTISALCGAMSITASAASATGDLTWDVSGNTLTIKVTKEGETAAMPDYNTTYSSVPWYYSRTNITKVKIEEGVTSIGAYAFYAQYTKITEVTLPSTIKSIGNYAFGSMSGLTTISFTDSDGLPTVIEAPQVETIGDYAFYNDTKVGPVPANFLQSATSVGLHAFEGCEKLFPDETMTANNLTQIGEKAFYNCKSLGGISITNTKLTTISPYAFYGTGVKTVALPSYGITTINDNAFQSCTKLTAISLPSSITTLGSYAFDGCSLLATIGMPSGVTTFGNYIFRGAAVATVSIPSSYTKVPNSMFNNCKNLKTVTFQGTNVTVIDTSAFGGSGLTSFDVPSSVKTIGSSAFGNCASLETISLKHGITEIGSSAFAGCSVLASITLPNTVKTLGANIFQNCKALKAITIPSSVTEIPNSAFSGCTNLTDIDFPDAITSIGTNAFQNCTSLQTIMLPDNLETVTGQSFTGCTALTAIKVSLNNKSFGNESVNGNVLMSKDGNVLVAYPAGLSTSVRISTYGCKKIGDYAFYNNTRLTSIDLDNSSSSKLEEIGNNAFCGCTGIKSLNFGPQVKIIGDYAFDGCTAITSLSGLTYAGDGLSIGQYAFRKTQISSLDIGHDTKPVTIGNYAFNQCAKLKTLTLKNCVSIGTGAFSQCSILPKVALPDTVTSLGGYAFSGCSELASVTLPKGITSIGASTFANCTKLTRLMLPSGITSIGKQAFTATGLTELTIPNSVMTLEDGILKDCKSLVKVVVPSQVSRIPQDTFSGCNNTALEIYLLGTVDAFNSSNTNQNAFGANSGSYVKGTIYVYDETSYSRVSSVSAVTTSGYATVAYGANFTELKNIIDEAKALSSLDYTESSFSVVASALQLADITAADYLASQGRADAAVASLRSAINGLVTVDNTEMLAKLADVVEHAKSDYIKSDYRDLSFMDLRAAYQAGDAVTGDELNSELKALIDAIENAEKNLVVNYAYGDPVMTVKSGKSLNNNYHYTYPCMEGVVTPAVAGATQAKVTIQMASHASFNGATKIRFKSFIEGTDENGEYVSWNTDGDTSLPDMTQSKQGSYSNPAGGTHEITFNIVYNGKTPHDAGLVENEFYHFYCWTEEWNTYPQYDYIAFYVLEVQLLDAEGNKLLSTKDVIVPNEDLLAAIDEADAADTTGASADSIQALTDAVAEANAVLEQEKPLPSAMESAAQGIRDAIKALSGGSVTPGVDKTALNDAISNAEGMDTSAYTDESVAALKTAIDNAKTVAANESATDEDVAAAVKAIEDAIAALAEKPGDDKVDKTELNNEIKTADEMDTSAYTEESVAALQTAIDNAKTVAANENATKADVDAAVKAIKDAVAALVKKPSGSDPSNNPSGSGNPSGSNNPSVTTPTAAPTTAAPAKRSAQQVAKDKAAAQAKVSQAKITKLTVKSKAKKKINVTWKKVKKAVGYQVQVSTKKNFKKITFNKFTTKKKLTVTKKLKSKKTYYVRVRAYATYKDVNNVTKKVYSKWNKKLRKVKVK